MEFRQVHSLREILLQQAVGLFIRAALPWNLQVAEVDLDVRRQSAAFVIRHLLRRLRLLSSLRGGGIACAGAANAGEVDR